MFEETKEEKKRAVQIAANAARWQKIEEAAKVVYLIKNTETGEWQRNRYGTSQLGSGFTTHTYKMGLARNWSIEAHAVAAAKWGPYEVVVVPLEEWLESRKKKPRVKKAE